MAHGYVILSDWTHEGGYAIAVQHSDGYVTVYKHAKQLLKRIGDRVRNREAIAISGNSGEITTGPHLHLEIWHNGLAQDPRYYFVAGNFRYALYGPTLIHTYQITINMSRFGSKKDSIAKPQTGAPSHK